MKLSDIDNKNRDEENGEGRRCNIEKKYFRRVNPTADIIIKIVIICAVIDIPLGVYLYFTKYKNNQQEVSVEVVRKVPEINRNLIKPNDVSLEKIRSRRLDNKEITSIQQPQRKLYSWTSENGYKVYSNKGCPNDPKIIRCEIKYY